MKKSIFLFSLTWLLVFSVHAQNKETKPVKQKSFESLTADLIGSKIDSTQYFVEIQNLETKEQLAKSVGEDRISTEMSIMSSGRILYVNAVSSGGNGLSWGSAYQSLQDALTAALSGDEIWVAQGAYKPTTTTTRTIAFTLKSGVSLYGGFIGNESIREQRNWNDNPTILSGEIGGPGLTDNSDHVVRGSSVSNIEFDGFIVEKGYATVSHYGGGLHCANVTNLTVRNCTFRNNYSNYHGGGVYSSGSSINIVNSIFHDNRANSYDGGGYYASGSLTKKIIGCLFYNNHAGRCGGGIILQSGSNLDIINTTVTNNTTGAYGGGIGSWGATVNIRNCISYDNTLNNLSRPSSGIIYVYYSLIHYNNNYTSGSNVMDNDPLYMDASTKNFRLLPNSPCVDAGTPDVSGLSLPDKDLSGQDRIIRDRVDMGCYEEGALIINYDTLYAIANGDWTNTGIWSNEENGSPVNVFPGAGHNVVINNFQITVESNQSCMSLDLNSANSILVISGKLTVHGTTDIYKGILKTVGAGIIEVVQ